MRQYQLLYRWVMSGALLLMTFTLVHAQTTETFTAGGTEHTLIYAPETANVDVVKTVLTDAVPIYNRLFGFSDVSIVITFAATLPAGRSDLLADASPNSADEPDCRVTIYPNRESDDINSLKFTIAHELSHCYQFETRPDPVRTFGRSEGDPNAWWIEGSAEWLAYKVYPPVGKPIADTIRNLFTISSVRVSDNDYEEYWFMRFLAVEYGEDSVITLIKTIPLDLAGQATYLNAIHPTRDLFGQYGMRIINNRFSEQPVATADAVEHFDVRALPGTQALLTDPLSVKIVHLSLPRPADGHGIGISLQADSDASYKVLWRDGTEISTGDGVQVCGDVPGGIFIAVARGIEVREGAVATLTFEDVPCEARPVEVPVCMLGTWNLIQLPLNGPPDPSRVEDLTGSYLEFREDSSATLHLKAAVTLDGLEGERIEMNLDMTFEGVYELGEIGPNTYSVLSGSGTILPEKSLTMTVAGYTQDLTSSIDRFLSMGTDGRSNTVFSCSENALIQTIEAGGVTLNYVYSR